MSPVRSFQFEPLSARTLPLLHEWLGRPHVAEWWQPRPSMDELRDDYLALLQPRSTCGYIAYLDDEPVGFIQRYVVLGSGDGWWEDETDPGARGIDAFLAEAARLGRGIGRAMVARFVADHLFPDPAVTTVQTDPHPANERAVRCFVAAGFHPVGRVTTPEGPALLMRWRRQPAPPGEASEETPT